MTVAPHSRQARAHPRPRQSGLDSDTAELGKFQPDWAYWPASQAARRQSRRHVPMMTWDAAGEIRWIGAPL